MVKKYDIVEVVWFDAQTHSGYAEDIGDVKDWDPVLSCSAGYLMHKDKEKIILGFMLFGEGTTKHCQMIPMGMVKKINKLKQIRDK